MASSFMNYSFQSNNSPIPGKDDVMVWSMAGVTALYGVYDYGVSLFSKKARGNWRDDELRGWSNKDIADTLDGLTGQLDATGKALKKKLTTEQKARTERNKQKKSAEKGTGTGRR